MPVCHVAGWPERGVREETYQRFHSEHRLICRTPESATAKPEDAAAAQPPFLFTAIQEQLGLRVRAKQVPVEVLMIDHVERPSEN
jgi:uncharacterized protein (TIGR03435 family)